MDRCAACVAWTLMRNLVRTVFLLLGVAASVIMAVTVAGLLMLA